MKHIYVVWEDNHGDVSYWSTEETARAEVLRIINDGYAEDDQFKTLEEAEEYQDCSWYREVELDRPWGA